MFLEAGSLACTEESDLNASGNVDITDLTFLVSYMFGEGTTLVDCSVQSPKAPKTTRISKVEAYVSTNEANVKSICVETPFLIRGINLKLLVRDSIENVTLIDKNFEMFSFQENTKMEIGILDIDGVNVINEGVHLIVQCSQPTGYVVDNTDCDDADSSITIGTIWYEDSDNDGWGDSTSTVISCTQPSNYVLDSTDNCPTISNPSQLDTDNDGIGDVCDTISTGVNEVNSGILPKGFILGQNYPNPFNPTTIIPFGIPFKTNVTIDIFNILGHRIRTFELGVKSAGRYELSWNSKDDNGQRVPSGVYIYRLEAGEFHSSKKMLLLK